MRIKINRNELLQSLSLIEPGLSQKDLVAQSTSFVFSGGWGITFNEEICCRAKTGLPADFVGAIRGKQLKTTLENMGEVEIDMEYKEGGDALKFKSGRKWASLRMESDIVLPHETVEEPQGWSLLPEGFDQAVKSVLETAGTNSEEFLTVVVHFDRDMLESCDRTQASRYFIDMPIQQPFLVRANSLRSVKDIGVTKISETPNWVHFRSKAAVVSFRRHVHAYPDLSPMLEFSGQPIELPSGVSAAARLSSVFAVDGEATDKLEVTLTRGLMRVVGKGMFGEAGEDLETAYRGPDLHFLISPAMLTQLVEKHHSCEVGVGKLRAQGERWTYMVLLGLPPGADVAQGDSDKSDLDSDEGQPDDGE